MADTGLDSFDKTVQKTNRILKDIEEYWGWEDRRDQSYDALRITLQNVRDLLNTDEAVEFADQLPALVKGFYYEGWNPSKTPKDMDKEEFLNAIRERFVYSFDGDMKELIKTVFLALDKHVSEGEQQDIRSQLPEKVAKLIS